MGKWGKWVMLLVVAMAFAVPAWAVDLKLGGKYEIQGRYYANPLIKDIPNDLTYPTTDMYLKHYFNLYPTLQVNDKIKIVADLEVFDNKISRVDEVNWYGVYQSYTVVNPTGAVTYPDETGSKLNTRNYKPYSQYNTFTVDALYADVTTGIGKFIAGKTKDFSGLAWFIQVPAAKDWAFGLVWNKKQEWGSALGTKNQNNTGDQDEFEAIAKLENANTLFDFRLAYRYSGAGHAQTRVWYPHLWFNQKFNDLVKMNLKLAYANGPLLQTGSPVGTAAAEALYDGLTNDEFTIPVPFPPYAIDLLPEYKDIPETMEKDWKVNNVWGAWLGFGFTPGNATIQIDGAYLPGAKKPNEVSAYLDDGENLDAWLMNDVHDIYAWQFETYATKEALGDPRVDGNYSFTNAILGRLNLAYKFTDKLKADLNFIMGQKENIKYLENWYYGNTLQLRESTANVYDYAIAPGLANAIQPSYMEGKFLQIQVTEDAAIPLKINKGNYISDVAKDLGWELRARMNYQWMDNLSFGIDLCYYKPGEFYKKLIENDFRQIGSTYQYTDFTDFTNPNFPYKETTWKGTGNDIKDTYAARWIAKVTF